MFLGHLAVGFAAKRVAPKASLGVLLGASELIDLLFPAFVLAGWEEVRLVPGDNPFLTGQFRYPLSHSLLLTAVWAGAALSLYWLLTRYRRGAAVVGVVAMSHWLLDVASHSPDMPLYPGDSPLLGLGLWYSVAGTITAELLMFAAGLWVYRRTTRPRSWFGRFGLWSFAALMLALYLSALFSPPAPDSSAFAWVGLVFAVFFCYAAWFDRHRTAV